MNIIGIRAVPLQLSCTIINGDDVNTFTYPTPSIYMYKTKKSGQKKTEFLFEDVIRYQCELASNLIRQFNIQYICVKKTETSSLGQAGINNRNRLALYLEGAMISLGHIHSIPCKGCEFSQYQTISQNGINQCLTDHNLTLATDDINALQRDDNSGQAFYSACYCKQCMEN